MKLVVYLMVAVVINLNYVNATTSFTPVVKNNFDVKNPLLLNNTIIYINSESNEIQINKGSTLSDTKPLFNDLPFASYNLVKNGDYVFFVNTNDNNTLWRFDGELFEKALDESLLYLSNYNGNVNYAGINGSNTIVYLDEFSNINSCLLYTSPSPRD